MLQNQRTQKLSRITNDIMATKIQKLYRGYSTRKRYTLIKEELNVTKN